MARHRREPAPRPVGARVPRGGAAARAARRGVRGSDVARRLTQVLAGWAAASVVGGAVLCRERGTGGFGGQTVAWGAVDGAIAVVGARRRAAKGPADPARLRTVLLVN